MSLPRLHVVTHDGLLAEPSFAGRADALMHAHGPALALHLRARHLATLPLYELAARLAATALRTGSTLFINDRVDVALAVRAGAHLHAESLPVVDARRLLHHAPLGYSAHAASEAVRAAAEGADYVFLGTIYPSASHPERAAGGAALIGAAAAALQVPAIAIGGVTPERVPELMQQGAYGVAVISGVWQAEDPTRAAQEYLAALALPRSRGGGGDAW